MSFLFVSIECQKIPILLVYVSDEKSSQEIQKNVLDLVCDVIGGEICGIWAILKDPEETFVQFVHKT